MGCFTLLLPILIILSIILLLLLFNIITISYGDLGLTQEAAVILLIAALRGSMINIRYHGGRLCNT